MTEFEKIYQEYFKCVYLYLKSLSNNEHIAEEITAETFFKALKSIDYFRGDCDIRVWLCQIAKNSYYTYIRKNSKYITIDEDENTPAIDDSIEQKMVDKEDVIRIHAILHEMEEPYKEVFTLRVFGELSFSQIAAIFGKNQNWACVTFHRAKKKIQEKMEESNNV